jgi:hypothetical protein
MQNLINFVISPYSKQYKTNPIADKIAQNTR